MWLALTLAAALQAAAPRPLELAPGTTYDPAIPTMRQVLGHDVGEVITPPEDVVVYLQALAKAAPARARVVEYARTWEGRPLDVIVLGSPERIGKLEEVKAGLRRLADPRALSAADADRLVKELPAVVWLMHAVHGNEISSTDAALAEAYHLLAARGDAVVDAILRDTLVVIDPLQNPDGRARFVTQNLLGRAMAPDAEPLSAEHDEPWPGGRVNHYLFDMNRDFFSQSQPETRGRIAQLLEWYPHVVVDLHEMGGNSTYYFAPPAQPINPHITKAQVDWLEAFGAANAKRFDARGFSYFNRELYDSFYPGYGESWPIFQGAIGMTYEQASARGLVFRRTDDTTLTYLDGVVHHFTAAVSTAHTAAVNREKLLRDFLEYRRSAVQEGERGPVREYLLPPATDASRLPRLGHLLAMQGFEVRRADASFKVGTRDFPAGTLVVPLAQPSSRLIRNLLEPHISQGDAFLKEQDRRRKLRLGDQIYDVTAWSLPSVFDIDVVPNEKPVAVKTTPVSAKDQPVAATLPAATVGYLLPWGSATATLVPEALAAGLRVKVVNGTFTLGGRAYPRGTALVRTADNGPDLARTLGALVSRHRAEVVPIDSAFVESGTSLGSGDVVSLRSPRVVLAWDAPTSTNSAGWARYVLERRFGQAASAVRVASLGRLDLRRYDVLVLPSGTYSSISGDQLRKLKDWIAAGGTLVTIGDASRWAARENVGLLDAPSELRGGRPDTEGADKKPEPSKQPIDYEKAIQPTREPPENTPGAILRVVLDGEHWLSAGTDGEIGAMVEGRRVFTPITLDKGVNVGVYAAGDRLVVGGLVWEDAREQLARKAFLVDQPNGQGHVIAFAEDPNYRAFTEATELLFINAVLLGPAF